jgi:hypothetical protein
MAYVNKQDQLASWKRWYCANKKTVRERVADRKAQIRNWVDNYKRGLSCERCPERDPVCLQFHHKDPKEKDLGISDAIKNGWGIDRLRREIEKCQVLCANCHLKIHHSGLAQSVERQILILDVGGSIPSP